MRFASTVKPQAAESHNALAYDFDNVKPDSTVVTMRWDKVAVPFKVQVKVNEMVTASIQRQIHGLNQYYWEGWDDAAGYFLANKINLDEALKDEDQSIQAEERYDNLLNKSKILEAHGPQEDAEDVPHQGAGQGQRRCNFIFTPGSCRRRRSRMRRWRSSVRRPRSFRTTWTSHMGLARVYSAQGDFRQRGEGSEAFAGRSAGFQQGQPGELREAVAEQGGH